MDIGAFASLVTEDKIAEVVRGFEVAIAQSFAEDRAPGRLILVHGGPRLTKSAMTDRANICIRIFKVLRGDLKWSLPRIMDHLPKFLRNELDGVPFTPEAATASWVA